MNSQEKFTEQNEKYKSRKLKNINVADKFNNNIDKLFVTEKTISRIKDCGNFLEFIVSKDLEKRKLISANFCKNRFCPICSRNLSVKTNIAIKTMLKYIAKNYKYRYIFLTLTVPNIDIDDLSDKLKEMNKAFNHLFKLKEIDNVNKGYIKKIEVTYNKDTNTFHPHFHVLIAINKSYFSKAYINRNRWLELWQKVMGDDSITQVDVRAVKDNKLDNAVLEISKYISKDNDYTFSDDVFVAFYKGLKSKRMMTYNKLFKLLRDMYKKGELDEYLDAISLSEYIYYLSQVWNFNNKNYDINELRKLTEDELKVLQKKFIKDSKNTIE